MKKFITYFLLIWVNFSLSAQVISKFKWPNHRVTPVLQHFLSAYNTGKAQPLKAFIQKYYTADRVASATRYWQRFYTQYGAIVPYKLNEQREDRLVIWFQGKHTKNWVEIAFVMQKKALKIRGTGVMRGMRPKGLLPPYKALPTDGFAKHLTTYLKKLHQLNHFSGAVLVAKGDQVLFEGAYGLRNKKAKLPNQVQTTFSLASTTKTFTAIAIAQLVEQGKLKYSDFISKYLPEYPQDIAQQVNIHHLLTHTSGIELDDYAPFNKAVLQAKNVEDLLKAQLKYMEHMNENRRKNFKVLDKHDYSNENFSLLGVIIERVSGMSYTQYIEQHIFKPANMKRSFADYTKLAKDQNKATGYTFFDQQYNFHPQKRQSNAVFEPLMGNPAGGIFSTVRDLYKYYRAINTHQIIKKSTHQLMFSPQTKVFEIKEMDIREDYGYGFSIQRLGKAYCVGHSGRKMGVGARFEYYPAQDIYVIVLSNYGFPANTVAAHIRDLIEPND